MSFQCPKCGTQTRDGAKFCHGCGTPIGTATLPQNMPGSEMQAAPTPIPPASNSSDLPPVTAAPPRPTSSGFATPTTGVNAPTGYLPQMPQTYHPQAVQAPPAKKSSGLLKGILISLGVILLLGTITVVAAIYFAMQTAKDIAKNLPPDLPITIGENAAKEIGVPVYPNAKQEGLAIATKGKGGKGDFKGGVITYTTEDSVDEVLDFYREKLGDGAAVSDNRENQSRHVEIRLEGKDRGTFITVSNDGGENSKTMILIATGGGKSPDTIPDIPPVKVEVPVIEDPPPPPAPPAPKTQKR